MLQSKISPPFFLFMKMRQYNMIYAQIYNTCIYSLIYNKMHSVKVVLYLENTQYKKIELFLISRRSRDR